MHLAASPSFDIPGDASRSATPPVALFTLFTAEARPLLAIDPRAGALVSRHIKALHGLTSRVLAWAVLADSVELLLSGAADGVRHLQRRTGSAIRALGHDNVWRGRFAALPIRPRHDLRAVLDYVLTAPERAGLVDRWTDWPWCGSHQWPGIDREFTSRHPKGLLWLDALTRDRIAAEL